MEVSFFPHFHTSLFLGLTNSISKYKQHSQATEAKGM